MTPKATVKSEKKDYVGTLSEKLKEAKSVVFVDYAGMGVSQQQDFKSKLREVGGNMLVAKNTLVSLAGKKAELPEEATDRQLLSGQTAMVFSGEDAVASIQILGKFAGAFEIPKIKAGVVEGVYQDKDGIVRITMLPSKEQLQANVVGAVAAPLYGTVGVLQANLQKLVFIIDQARQKGGDQ
jgi:large subunit ribosomal protein L10